MTITVGKYPGIVDAGRPGLVPMGDPMAEIRTLIELEEGSIPIRVVEMVEYFDAEGGLRYAHRYAGCGTWSELFGVIEQSKFSIWQLSQETEI